MPLGKPQNRPSIDHRTLDQALLLFVSPPHSALILFCILRRVGKGIRIAIVFFIAFCSEEQLEMPQHELDAKGAVGAPSKTGSVSVKSASPHHQHTEWAFGRGHHGVSSPASAYGLCRTARQSDNSSVAPKDSKEKT